VYFCLLHSLRHLTGTLGVLPERRQALHSAAGITALSLAGAALAALLLLAGAGAVVDAAMLQVVFIGLAALTVPHMLLVDRFVRTGPHCDIDPPMVNRPGMPL
jgi:beta-carotene 15,15'-dioxygenase